MSATSNNQSLVLPCTVVTKWNNTPPLYPGSKGSSGSGSLQSSRLSRNQGPPGITENIEPDESVARRLLLPLHIEENQFLFGSCAFATGTKSSTFLPPASLETLPLDFHDPAL
jgi:hypothetical protein